MEEWNDTGIVGWDRPSGMVKGEWDAWMGQREWDGEGIAVRDRKEKSRYQH